MVHSVGGTKTTGRHANDSSTGPVFRPRTTAGGTSTEFPIKTARPPVKPSSDFANDAKIRVPGPNGPIASASRPNPTPENEDRLASNNTSFPRRTSDNRSAPGHHPSSMPRSQTREYGDPLFKDNGAQRKDSERRAPIKPKDYSPLNHHVGDDSYTGNTNPPHIPFTIESPDRIGCGINHHGMCQTDNPAGKIVPNDYIYGPDIVSAGERAWDSLTRSYPRSISSIDQCIDGTDSCNNPPGPNNGHYGNPYGDFDSTRVNGLYSPSTYMAK